MFDLNEIEKPHRLIAIMLGAASLSGKTVCIIPHTDDDLEVTKRLQEEENQSSLDADFQMALNLVGY